MFKDRFISFLTFEKRYSPHTIKAYEMEVKGFLDFLEAENVPFEEVDHKLMRYYFSLLREKGKEASSVNRAISTLRSYYKFLQREQLVEKNPVRLI